MASFPEVYILRHGETEWNAENRMQGALNSPLTAKGKMDAELQAGILAGHDLTGFDYWCSPQARAVQTAGIALARVADWIRTDDRLREIGVGEWAGLLRDTLPMPDGPDPVAAQYAMAPGGEGFARLEARCIAFLSDLTGPAVLVTHGITSRVLRRILAGDAAIASPTPHGGQGRVYHVKNGVQTLLEA
jgi:probable phosphoglycerate mutase